ncbi:MAG: hypothetical protein LUD15_01235 [Bacteroides sp.]|nr:hypothetical protein [Bacteroides sp.]
MQQLSQSQADSLSTDELIQDLVFLPGNESAVSGVKVDFTGATTLTEYAASNGTVKVMRGVDIKLRKNKIKSIIIEGEDFNRCLDENTLLTRYRPLWASPYGEDYDIMLSGRAQQKRDSIDDNGNPVLNDNGDVITITTTFNYETTNGTFATEVNYFIEYKARLNSVDYKIRG